MNIEKLNNCLSEMDTLTKVDLSTEGLLLFLVFNCFDGGFYENVELKIEIKGLELLHLPFLANGHFKFIALYGDARLERISGDYMEYDPQVYKFIIDDSDIGFYVSFQELEWSVSGPGTKNKYELAC